MSDIKKVELAVKEIRKIILDQVPKLKFLVHIGINPLDGKYTIECRYKDNLETKKTIKIPLTCRGFLVNISKDNKIKYE